MAEHQYKLRVVNLRNGEVRESIPCSFEYASELKERKIQVLQVQGYTYDLNSHRWFNVKSPVEWRVSLVRLPLE